MKSTLLFLLLFITGYNYAQDTWTQKADFGGGNRGNAVGFNIGNKGYLGTGLTGNGKSSDFWQYDPATNGWTQKADVPGGTRYSAVGFSIGNKGYIGTGENGTTQFANDFYEYDAAANSWTQKTNFPGEGRWFAVGFSIGNKGYIGTGFNYYFANPEFSDFWEFDPATDTWARKADFAGGSRASATGFSIGNKGYIQGGHSNDARNDFWEYDPAADSWTRKADFGGGNRENAVGFSIYGRGYLGTGDNGSNGLNDFWKYNPSSDVWTQESNFSGASRYYATGFSIGDKGYIGTGASFNGDNTYSDFYQFTPLLDSIITGATTGSPFCAGSNVSVSFTTIGTTNTGNVFTAQLSDASGSFANPVNIGTLNSVMAGTINAIIPSNTGSGAGYRIRVISSDPAVTGSDNGTDITINAPITFYRDYDGDNFGDARNSIQSCSQPLGYVTHNTDCKDSDATIYPGAPELCDGKDNNCNGQVDEGCSNITAYILPSATIEGNNGKIPMLFAVILNKAATATCSVKYNTYDLTAKAGSDYQSTQNTVTFKKGQFLKFITIYVYGDKTVEPNEQLGVQLQNPMNVKLYGTGKATGTIFNDDFKQTYAASASTTIAETNVRAMPSLQVFPNPASSIINVDISGFSNNISISLSDLQGKVLKLIKLQQGFAKSAQQINVSSLSSGAYFLMVTDDKGTRQTEKVIISR